MSEREKTPDELCAQTHAAFCACNTIDGFRVPDGMRLEWRPKDNVWVESRAAQNQLWDTQEHYRLVPIVTEPERVPLGPEDVPPGSVLRSPLSMPGTYIGHTAVTQTGIILDTEPAPWQSLVDANWQINSSLPLTGRWDATAWEPCSKPATLPAAVTTDWPGEGYRLLVVGEVRQSGDDYLSYLGGVLPCGNGVGLAVTADTRPVRRKMPNVCPFAPGQVLETLTDVEDARYWQDHGVAFDGRNAMNEWRRGYFDMCREPFIYRRSL